MVIYKIFRGAEWADMQAKGATTGAPIDVADGFIHFSGADTVAKTAALYFADLEDLHLIAVEATGCEALKWEASRGGALFPHLFRPLRMEDVLWHKPLPIIAGVHEFGDLTERHIYKIWTNAEWTALQDVTTGSALDQSDRFIHFSEVSQVPRVLAHFFAGQSGLKLSKVRAILADPALKYEDAGNGEMFPHLYRPLHRTEIIETRDIPLQGDQHELPF